MSEQAHRSTAGTRATATGAQDRGRRHGADVRPAAYTNRTTPRERDLRPVPDPSPGAVRDFSPRGDRAGLATTPRSTVVIRGQVADRYTAHRHPSARRQSRGYGLGMRPERAALWAVLLGLALVTAALASAQL